MFFFVRLFCTNNYDIFYFYVNINYIIYKKERLFKDLKGKYVYNFDDTSFECTDTGA